MRPRSGSPLLAAVLVLLAALLTPGAALAAAGNHPPGAPVRLTVDDLVAPLAVEGAPHFGWLPRDRDRNEVQTAYQVVVTRSGRVVWDSGRVASSRQSWVAGPELETGTTYRWTVRTWDRRGVASPYARPASFDTALRESDWSGAAWIRRPATGNDAANEWTLARKVVPVGRGTIVRARAYLSATSDWELLVNGVPVSRGTSYGYPGEGYYDVTALTNLTPGKPAVIGVRYHYWTCRCQGRANGPQAPEGPSGLLAKIVVDHADGTRETTVSDGSWRVTRDTAQDVTTLTYRNSDAGDRVEYVDATREVTGWHSPGFDDSAWTAATVVGTHPRPNPPSCTGYGSSPCAFTHLRPQQAHLRHETIHPVSVRRLPDGTVFADFGKVVAAVPRVAFEDGTAGHQVTMTTGYRRNNSTLTAATAPGARTVSPAAVGNVHPGDEITVDAPAGGYGPGAPETRVVTSVDPQGTVTVDRPLRRAHAAGAWVENSRAGTSRLDTQGSDMRFHYTQKHGEQVAQPFTYWGWRYLEISDPGEHLSARDIAAVTQATDVAPAEAATFTSDNPTLDAVFDLMRHSALYSAQNVFLDTPTREKGQFLGDTIDQSFATMEALNERALTRQAIVEFMGSQDRFWPNGAMNAVYPNGDGKRDIPDYTEMFPEWVMRYHQLTGDDDLVRQALPAMRRVAGYLSAAVDPRGLVTNLPGGSGAYTGGIIDWPAPMRYDSVITGNASRTVVNALAVGAFHAVADGAEVVGDPVTAAEYHRRAAALTTAMNAHLLDPATGLYADGLTADGQRIPNSSQHAQSFPVAYGVAPDPDHLAAYLGGMGMRQGPMTLRQLLAAVPPPTVLRLLTDATGEGPAQVLAEGGTFLWEQWRPGCPVAPCRGTQVDQSSSESFSHGWGAAGISAILQSLLGLRVTGPGAETLTIAPPATGLSHARGTAWTERGPVTVAWRRTGERFSLDVTLPVNVTATVVLPTGERFTAGSGRSHFQS
jgi:hypothetical protein